MKQKRNRKKLWVAVKVERGFISQAKVYESFDAAQRTVRKWRSRLNPDYDEADVLKAC
jgi:transposase